VIPIELGDDADFDTLRKLLDKSGFTEAEIIRRFGIGDIADFEDDTNREQIESYAESATGVLIRLFIEGRYVNEQLARAKLSTAALQAMERLGVITSDEDEPDCIEATVALYPTADVFITSDRWNTPDRTPFVVCPDIVYSAIVANAQRFLAYLPTEPCDDFLDLCSGTGVAALSAARRFARRSYAFDVTERSSAFAEFNRRLNGIDNARVGTGDLYEPAQGIMFDRIVAHPPYVPVLRPKYVYHDGGEDGEAITRRIVEGLPHHLKPGGLFFMAAMGSDRNQAPFEQRMREWLGEYESEFDIALSPKKLLSPEEFGMQASAKSETPLEDMAKFKQVFSRLHVWQFVYGFVHIQRRTESRAVFTVRRQAGPRTASAELKWMRDWETSLVTPGAIERILGARARRNPEAELHIAHTLADEGWSIAEYMLRTIYPFAMEARTDAWSPFLVAMCDGTKTLRELFAELKEREIFPETADIGEFAQAVGALVSGGFIFLE
jgi:methylase of polypeptide subunit release factors